MRSNPERLAWRILLTAFLVFLLLCSTAAYLVQWYLFQSTVEMAVELEVARGTVSLTLPETAQPIAVTSIHTDIQPGAKVETDQTSQAVLTFSDPRSGERVASIVVFRESAVRVQTASVPRFRLSKAPYQIYVENASGHLEVLVLDTEWRDTQVGMLAPQLFAEIQKPGQYLLDASPDQTDFTTRVGEAVVSSTDRQDPAVVAENERVVLREGSNELLQQDAEYSVLENPFFSEPFEDGWLFYNDKIPPGRAYDAVFDGRPVVVIDRSQGNWPDQLLDHAETGLVQNMTLDVSDFDSIELRATFYVEEQSLERCGRDASECPLMLHMNYIDVFGNPREFYHGFYANDVPGSPWPFICASCRSDHERISPDSWFTYESGNLFTLFPPEQKPRLITQLSFYASGHAYKIYVSEMNLLASHHDEE